MEFKKGVATIEGKRTDGYHVINPGKVFRGLKVFVAKPVFPNRKINRWYAYEETTGTTLTPDSWQGGLSNHTRAGVMEIVAKKLSETSEFFWEIAQKRLDYQLEKPEGAG